MARRFGPGEEASMALDEPVVHLNTALLEYRFPKFFLTSDELRERGLPIDAPVTTPTLFWYSDDDENLEGLILGVVPVDLPDEIERADRIYAQGIDLETFARGEMNVRAEFRRSEGGVIKVEYVIEPTGYFQRFEGKGVRIKDNSERRLFQTREIFNSKYELSELNL